MYIPRANTGGKPHGFSLIELVIFIAIIGIAMAGILMVMSLNAGHAADPLARKQALAIAEALLEEVEMAPFATVDSRDGWHGNAAGGAPAFTVPAGYGATVTVAADGALGPVGTPISDTAVRRITVTVTFSAGSDSVTLEGYRTNY